ncbi:MAG: hypothetical protein KBH11_12635 [Bacteroidia bacterium]|nr:hypothetical protein [Bacteroidia bacterium]
MAINQNHLFDDLDGVKCAIVEKNASQSRVDFLKPLLELNGFVVVVVGSPPPKAAPAAVPAEGSTPEPVVVPPPTTFTIGVTDVRFNATNAIFGRLLKTKDNRIVTLSYWQQKESISEDTVPYFEK